jgi:sigma-54-specific transcriptional regulator
VRELRNLCERVVLVEKGPEITAAHLHDLGVEYDGGKSGAAPAVGDVSTTIAPVELSRDGFDLESHIDEIVRQAFELNEENQSRTARYLNITREVLRHRLKKLGLLGSKK